jgi:hypothetical protein
MNINRINYIRGSFYLCEMRSAKVVTRDREQNRNMGYIYIYIYKEREN